MTNVPENIIVKPFYNDLALFYKYNQKIKHRMTQNIIHCPPDPNFEPDPRGIGALFMDRMRMFKNKIAQIDATTGKYQTYEEFLLKSIRVAQHLQATGITRNDVITICSYNTMDSYLPFIAALFLGIPVSAIDPSLSTQDASHLLKIVKPKVIFSCIESVQMIEDALKNANLDSKIVVFDDLDNYTSFSEFVRSTGMENEFECVKVDVHDTAIIFFSSGTTGLPKGICSTHFGMLNQLPFFKPGKQFQRGGDNLQVFLYFTTLYWISAVMILVITIASGSARLLCKTFEDTEALKLISKYKVTFLFLSPYYMHSFLKYPKIKASLIDTSTLKKILVGGGVVSEEQILALRKMFPSALVTNGYGMTEAGGITNFDPDKDYKYILEKPASVGKPMQGVTYKVVDPETEEILGPNQHGELRVKSNRFMKGYYNNPTESAQAWDQQGYLRTGDICYYDEDQCFFIVDRMKEMLKYKSWHITPAELEGILSTHPDVKECAVLGLPHDIDGELPMAVIVRKAGSISNEKDILNFFNEQVPDRKKLRGGVKFVDSLPYTPTGKLRRRYLKQILFT